MLAAQAIKYLLLSVLLTAVGGAGRAAVIRVLDLARRTNRVVIGATPVAACAMTLVIALLGGVTVTPARHRR